MRFIIEQSEQPNKWVCTDTLNKIVVIFEHHKFNDTQKVTTLDDFDTSKYMKLAQYMREMGDWLNENHKDKIF